MFIKNKIRASFSNEFVLDMNLMKAVDLSLEELSWHTILSTVLGCL